MAAHNPPVADWPVTSFADDVWELYDTNDRLDPGARPRRASTRKSSRELKRLFIIEAARYNVLPLDDRSRGARRS